jgi:hypothetical protein
MIRRLSMIWSLPHLCDLGLQPLGTDKSSSNIAWLLPRVIWIYCFFYFKYLGYLVSVSFTWLLWLWGRAANLSSHLEHPALERDWKKVSWFFLTCITGSIWYGGGSPRLRIRSETGPTSTFLRAENDWSSHFNYRTSFPHLLNRFLYSMGLFGGPKEIMEEKVHSVHQNTSISLGANNSPYSQHVVTEKGPHSACICTPLYKYHQTL